MIPRHWIMVQINWKKKIKKNTKKLKELSLLKIKQRSKGHCFVLHYLQVCCSGVGVVLDSIQRPGEIQYNQIYLHCEIWDAYQHDNTTNGLEEKIEEKYEKAEWAVWSGKQNRTE